MDAAKRHCLVCRASCDRFDSPLCRGCRLNSSGDVLSAINRAFTEGRHKDVVDLVRENFRSLK
jgi:hypothetical protein